MYASTDAEFDAIVAEMIAQANAFGLEECVAWTAEQALLRRAAENEAMGR